jgi:peptide/nickel transport system substrate-binding protein
MSLGIDRNEINELVFLGQGTPRAATINESSSIFKKEWAENYAKYDLAQANKLLDEVGLDKKGSDGIRLRPDGKPMAFSLEYLPQEGPKKEVCELVVKHWAQLAIKVDAHARDRAFLLTRLNAGQHDASGWQVDRCLERAAWSYGWGQKLGPGGNSAITYARAWIDWFNSEGKTGVEPPKDAKDLFDAWANWQKTAIGTPEFKESGTKLYDLIAKNLYVIGVIGQAPSPIIVKNNVENVFKPDSKNRIWWGPANWFWVYHAAEQWFLKS